jgi:hypothetical protein
MVLGRKHRRRSSCSRFTGSNGLQPRIKALWLLLRRRRRLLQALCFNRALILRQLRVVNQFLRLLLCCLLGALLLLLLRSLC